MEEEIEGKMKILFPNYDQMDFYEKDACYAKENKYKELLNELNSTVKRQNKINLLRWVSIHPPKFDMNCFCIILWVFLIGILW